MNKDREAKIEAKIHSDPTYPIQQLNRSSPYPSEGRHKWFIVCNQAKHCSPAPLLPLFHHNKIVDPSGKHLKQLFGETESKDPAFDSLIKTPPSCGYRRPFYWLYTSTALLGRRLRRLASSAHRSRFLPQVQKNKQPLATGYCRHL